ncbi:MAG: hypothetical protein IJM09_05760 [Neisseriaceae bacterium]|nr:hypothetical protein [Neisseriaceae bacterium]
MHKCFSTDICLCERKEDGQAKNQFHIQNNQHHFDDDKKQTRKQKAINNYQNKALYCEYHK